MPIDFQYTADQTTANIQPTRTFTAPFTYTYDPINNYYSCTDQYGFTYVIKPKDGMTHIDLSDIFHFDAYYTTIPDNDCTEILDLLNEP